MTKISNFKKNDNAISHICERFIKRFHVRRILREIGATKEKGFPAYEVFEFLLGVAFSGRNLFTLLSAPTERVPFKKDTIYRFLKKSSVNWNEFLTRLALPVVFKVNNLTSEERRTALIIDDTPFYRDRSKRVELLSRLYDHSEGKYYKGFNLLNMGWSDGQTFLPIDFRLAANSDNKKLIEGTHIKEDNRTLVTKRRRDAQTSKPKLVLEMLKRVKGTVAEAKYVLFDSWFSCPSLILSIDQLGYNVVARLKANDNFRYEYQGEILSINQIYSKNRKRRGRSKYLLSVMVSIRHNDFEEQVSAKIVYVRKKNKNERKKWIALISTDIALDEEEIITLYGKRWAIESFHKIIKSLLGLEKSEVRSYDALVAHTTIVMTRYLFLSLETRENIDFSSVNSCYVSLCDELEDISFSYAFSIIIELFEQCVKDYIGLTKEQIIRLVDDFMSRVPVFIKQRLGLLVCES